jgi:hypothetical protein
VRAVSAKEVVNMKKSLISKIFGFAFVQSLVCVVNSGTVIDSLQSVKGSDTFNEASLSNNYEHSYRTDDLSENYLNYRAVYNLRYKPTKKSMMNNYNHISSHKKSRLNTTLDNEVISASEDETRHANDSSVASSSTESEILLTHINATSESLETLLNDNHIHLDVEPTVDESRKHIMRPNNRVEFALNFLGERLKQLLYHSSDKSRPESKLSPHLSSLGRFLNLFTLIKLDSIPCLSAKKPLRQLSGTCYSETDCLHLGGVVVDRCLNGFGVCCVCKFSARFKEAIVH